MLMCFNTWSQLVALFDVVDPFLGEAAGGHEAPVTSGSAFGPSLSVSLTLSCCCSVTINVTGHTSHTKARAVATMFP